MATVEEAAEKAVLGACLVNENTIPEVVTKLRADDFHYPIHQQIFTLISEKFTAGQPVEPVTLAAELWERTGQNNTNIFFKLSDSVQTTVNVDYHIDVVKETAQRRKLGALGTRITQLADTNTDSDLIVQEINDGLALATTVDESETVAVGNVVDAVMTEVEARQQGTSKQGLMTGFTELDELTGGLKGGQMIIVAARPGLGKALPLDTKIPTPTGWTTMGEIQPGDTVFGMDGNPCTVTFATDVMHNHTCYNMEFSDGSSMIADAEHLWLTHDRKERRYGKPPSVRTTQQIKDTLRTETADARLNHSVPIAQPLNLPEADLPISPYTLGLWLGDGTSKASSITVGNKEILQHIEGDGYRAEKKSAHLRYSLQIGDKPEESPNSCRWCGWPRIYSMSCQDCRSTVDTFSGRLHMLNVWGNKHIPAPYLRASERQRRELLSGLVDSDGTISQSGPVQIAITSKKLALGIEELVVSLGYRAQVSTKRVRGATEASSTCYTITFSTDTPAFKLSWHQGRWEKRRIAKSTARTNKKFIKAVNETQSVPVRCIQVDSPDHTYLAGERMTVTHNTTLATDFMRHASIKNNIPTLIFSLEMGKEELVERIISAESSVYTQNLKKGRMSDSDWGKAAEAVQHLDNAPLYIADSPELTMVDIAARARLMQAQYGIKMIVVDYLQLLTSGRKTESRQQEVSDFSRQLKLLAKSLDVPIIAVAQLNRGVEMRGEDALPKASDLRESGSLEQDADIILLIHRPDAANRDHARAGEADLIVAKHRGGSTGTISLAHELHMSRFQNPLPRTF